MGKGARLFLVCVICALFTGMYAWVSLSRSAGPVRDVSLPPVVAGLGASLSHGRRTHRRRYRPTVWQHRTRRAFRIFL